jgi:hypothetical protein
MDAIGAGSIGSAGVGRRSDAYLDSAGEDALNGVGLTFTCNTVILANFFLQTMC